MVTRDNTASDVWADTAHRSCDNEGWLKSMTRVSRIHRKKPRGKPMSPRTAGVNAKRSTARPRRTRLCPAEVPDGAIHPHHRHCPRRGEGRPRQPGLQHRPPDLPRASRSHGIVAPGGRFAAGNNRIRLAQTANDLSSAPVSPPSSPCTR